jgi:hypothetical protein
MGLTLVRKYETIKGYRHIVQSNSSMGKKLVMLSKYVDSLNKEEYQWLMEVVAPTIDDEEEPESIYALVV